MQLSPSECRIFYKLHPALMCYANWKQKILPDQPGDPAEFYALDPEKRVKVRDALHAQPDLIDQFVQDNPFGFSETKLGVVRSWKHALVGSFYVSGLGPRLSEYIVAASMGQPWIALLIAGSICLLLRHKQHRAPKYPVVQSHHG